MDWLKKHGDTIILLGSFAVCFWNLNEKFNDKFSIIEKQISAIEKDLAIVKTVMIMQNMLPKELASKD